MNRAERRRAARAGVKVEHEPTVNVKLSDLGKGTPTQQAAMMHEIHRQCLEADKALTLDMDTVVLWTLYRLYGFGVKRLHNFYIEMAKEHQRMRHYYEIDDLFPERLKLKEMGVDLEAWQKEIEVILNEKGDCH
ncbi:MAG: hypothetical protein NC489_21715 [Ruminococcus flavefaciens]|nr:hypothetical protein [Ruminococcus flavefaciens]